MKTESSAPNLIWTLIQTSFCFNPVGDHQLESNCLRAEEGLDTSWLNSTTSMWVLTQTQSGGKRLNRGTQSKRFHSPKMKWTNIFWTAHVSAKSEPVKAGQKQQWSREGGTEISPKVMREWDRGWSKPSKEATMQWKPIGNDTNKHATLLGHVLDHRAELYLPCAHSTQANHQWETS